MECSTKVFGEGSLGIKAQMSTVTGCLVWAFPANNIKNAKKLSGGLGALNAATHGAVARAIESKDLDTAKNIMSELDTPDKKLRAEMLKRLKDIYVTNYHKVKSQKTSRGVKIIGSEDPPKKEKDKKR